MEILFGDTKPSSGKRSQSSDNASLAKSVMPRQLLPWSVIYSEATNMWVATVNTNQKALDSKNVVEASKSLRAFSVVTERQATCLAKAWSPPRMHAFNKNPACHICKARFAVFRRACHCRNCGVAICVGSNGCSRPWPAKVSPTVDFKQL
jgi:FYVE zinc finger